MLNQNEENSSESIAETNESNDCILETMFSDTQPYSDEITIKNILSKIINWIVIEQDEVAFKCLSYNKPPLANKKRKLDEISNGINDDEEYLNSIRGIDLNRKKLNPVGEHYAWCPWLATTNKPSTSFNQSANRNVCEYYYDVVGRFLRQNSSPKQHVAVGYSTLNADQLMSRVKSVQSLLINCTSQYNLK